MTTNGADAGRVVFCNRAYQRTTSLFDDEQATIQAAPADAPHPVATR